MGERPRSERTRVRREPKRGAYDGVTIDAILDGIVCHLGFVQDGQPYVIPSLYSRLGDEVYFHGSSASRMLLKATSILRLSLDEASVKVRTGPPSDNRRTTTGPCGPV
jgi:nitroimidazol reductase NimA-like FMN-containing flavoprotein (pyridoxamine 5'-phosphate oxidase superfamily)